MQDSLSNQDALGFDLPTPEQGLVEAKRRLALTFRRSELVWLAARAVRPGHAGLEHRRGAAGRERGAGCASARASTSRRRCCTTWARRR